ncbi:MAG: glycosyltransferase family 4 protein [Acidimicrobiia bacterium]|nr:glycosyltransferase family 4 protein [Acidimicrobiia bacterium]
MKVWLIKAGEPTPVDRGQPRLFRTGQLARCLAGRGHDVVWWTAAFDHQRKRFRDLAAGAATVEPGFRIEFVSSPGYRWNVSFRRWLDDIALAAAMWRRMRASPQPPDVIVCAFPLLFTALAAVRYGRARGIPVLMDVRDMWPDIFADVETGVRGGVYRMFASLNRPLARRILAGADGLIGITEPFLDWALQLAARRRSPGDAVIPLTWFPQQVPDADRERALADLALRGVTAGTRNICYFGAFTSMVDLETVVEAARALEDRPDVRIILCGLGDEFESIRRSAAGVSTLVLPGFVDAATMTALMGISIAGLAPYRHRRDSAAAVSNKVVQYLSAGLPVIAGFDGLVGDLVEREACGLRYAEGDPAGLAAAIRRLADTPGLAARLGTSARHVYDVEFAPDRVYGWFTEHVERAAGARAGAGAVAAAPCGQGGSWRNAG